MLEVIKRIASSYAGHKSETGKEKMARISLVSISLILLIGGSIAFTAWAVPNYFHSRNAHDGGAPLWLKKTFVPVLIFSIGIVPGSAACFGAEIFIRRQNQKIEDRERARLKIN